MKINFSRPRSVTGRFGRFVKTSCTILFLMGWLSSTNAQSNSGSLRKLESSTIEFDEESNRVQSEAESRRKLYIPTHFEYLLAKCGMYEKYSKRTDCDKDDDCIWDPRQKRCLLYKWVENNEKRLQEIGCANHETGRDEDEDEDEEPCNADGENGCAWHPRKKACLRKKSLSVEEARDLTCAKQGNEKCEEKKECYVKPAGYGGDWFYDGNGEKVWTKNVCYPRAIEKFGCYRHEEYGCKNDDECLWIPKSFWCTELPTTLWDSNDCAQNSCVHLAPWISSDCKSKEYKEDCEGTKAWTSCRWTGDDTKGRCDPVYRHCKLRSEEECRDDKLCVIDTLTGTCVSAVEAQKPEFSDYKRDITDGRASCPNHKPKEEGQCGPKRFEANLKCGYDHQIFRNKSTGEQECHPTSLYECRKSGDSDFSWEQTWTKKLSQTSLGECDARSWVPDTKSPSTSPSTSPSQSPTRTMSPTLSQSPSQSPTIDCATYCAEQFGKLLTDLNENICVELRNYADDNDCDCGRGFQEALNMTKKSLSSFFTDEPTPSPTQPKPELTSEELMLVSVINDLSDNYGIEESLEVVKATVFGYDFISVEALKEAVVAKYGTVSSFQYHCYDDFEKNYEIDEFSESWPRHVKTRLHSTYESVVNSVCPSNAKMEAEEIKDEVRDFYWPHFYSSPDSFDIEDLRTICKSELAQEKCGDLQLVTHLAGVVSSSCQAQWNEGFGI